MEYTHARITGRYLFRVDYSTRRSHGQITYEHPSTPTRVRVRESVCVHICVVEERDRGMVVGGGGEEEEKKIK